MYTSNTQLAYQGLNDKPGHSKRWVIWICTRSHKPVRKIHGEMIKLFTNKTQIHEEISLLPIRPLGKMRRAGCRAHVCGETAVLTHCEENSWQALKCGSIFKRPFPHLKLWLGMARQLSKDGHWSWHAEFKPLTPQQKREPTSTSCPLTPTCPPQRTHIKKQVIPLQL